jgi:hypothetical protein
VSDSSEPGFDRSLFARVRREGPSEALRQRILVQGRGEISRAEISRAQREQGRQAPLRSSRVRLRRVSYGALLAAAAVLAGVMWLSGSARERISITAENTGPRSVEPQAHVPEQARSSEPVAPPPELPPAPRQSAAARSATMPRVGVTAARPKSADAGAALATPRAAAALPSLAEQVDHIKRARAALRAGRSEQALVLLDEYQNGSGGSELAAEAGLLRIEALAAAGRKAEAASEARRFATDFPTSPLIDRAQRFAGE